MVAKLMSLRYDESCGACGAPTPARSKAWYDPSTRLVTCCRCRASVAAPPMMGRRVGDAAAVQDRQVATRNVAIERRWGRLAPLVKLFSPLPQSSTAGSTAAVGEGRLGSRLERALAGTAVVLHERRVTGTRGNIDHIVVAASGVWVIDAKNYSGHIQRRDLGKWPAIDHRLSIGGRDQTKLVDKMHWQHEAVRSALDPIGLGAAPVHRALCFTDCDWGLFAKPFQMDRVWVIWPNRLVQMIRQPGPIDAVMLDRIGRQLRHALPAASEF